MPPSQCLGRLVRDTPKGVWLLAFEDGGVFHIPIRCDTIARNGDLCDACIERERKTLEKVKNISGTTIKGTLPSYINGRVNEPIPFWSRLYDGAWFRLKIQSGCIVSEATMVKVRNAVAKAYEGVTPVEPQAMPGSRKIKAATTAVPVVKKSLPKATPVSNSPVATISSDKPLPVEDTRNITVRKVEVDGRALYLDPVKEKLYDLKFKYIGRLKDDKIVPFPDSDAEI